MNLEETQTMLGLAFLENHPRLEVMQNLNRIAVKLEDSAMQAIILNAVQRIYLPSTTKLTIEAQDAIFEVLALFCEHCVKATFSTMQDHDFREVHTQMEKIMEIQEETWRKKQTSSATAAANTALDWLVESIIGRNLSIAERAVMRGIFLRRQHLRGI
jgi:hypothetical protein